MQDQVGQDGLLLLPPCFAIVPDVAIPLLARSLFALYYIVPAAALSIHAHSWHDFGDLLRKSRIALAGVQMVDTHQVPGNLQIVSDDGAVLLPAPGLILAPVLEEAFLHEWAVFIVLEVFDNRIE